MHGALTAFHVLLGLIGIVAGCVVTAGLFSGRPLERWTKIFIATTMVASATGFLFPVDHFMISHALGIIALLALSVAIVARYRFHLAGPWRSTYAIAAIAGFYCNIYTLVFALFIMLPPLQRLAPMQEEPPYVMAQASMLVAFIVMAAIAVRRSNATIVAE